MMMQAAFYKGRKRLFNRLTAWWLRGSYSHTELVLGYDDAGQAICASSSMMDGGVRVKHMTLNPDHWDIVPVSGSTAATCVSKLTLRRICKHLMLSVGMRRHQKPPPKRLIPSLLKRRPP